MPKSKLAVESASRLEAQKRDLAANGAQGFPFDYYIQGLVTLERMAAALG